MALLLLCIFGSFALLNGLALQSTVLQNLSSTGATLLAGASFLLARRRQAPALAGHLLVGSMAFQVFVEMLFSGGLTSPVTPAMVLIVPIAILTCQRSGVLAWVVVTALGLAIVSALDIGGLLPAPTDDANVRRMNQGLTLLASVAGCAWMARRFADIAIASVQTLEQERERFRTAALHDPLTGLPNRAAFHQQVPGLLHAASRSGRLGVLLYIDVDGFKAVNDQHGHAAGDQLLVAFAQRLQARFGRDDLVSRLAGDEFAVVAVVDAQADPVHGLVARIHDAVAEPFGVDDLRLVVGASVGAAQYPADGRSIDALLQAADERMYREKEVSRATRPRGAQGAERSRAASS